MTDFIHEPKNKPEKDTPPAYVPPKSEKERVKRVYLYSVILFGAAFLLILWSFLANNQQWRDELRNNSNVLQSSIEENIAQDKQIAALEAQVEDLTERLERTETALDAAEDASEKQEASICALDRLRGIESAFEADRYKTARELVLAFEDSDLAQYLPDHSLHTDSNGNDAESPLATYERIVAKLFPDGID